MFKLPCSDYNIVYTVKVKVKTINNFLARRNTSSWFKLHLTYLGKTRKPILLLPQGEMVISRAKAINIKQLSIRNSQ